MSGYRRLGNVFASGDDLGDIHMLVALFITNISCGLTQMKTCCTYYILLRDNQFVVSAVTAL